VSTDLTTTRGGALADPALAALSTAELRGELSRTLELTAQHLVRLAQIVRLLEERGEDLSDLRIGLLHYLRKIAHGQVLAEVVVRFAEFPALIQRVSALPLPDQQRLAGGDSVLLAVLDADGRVDQRMVDPLRLSRDQVTLIFARDRLRDVQEQVVMMEQRKLSGGTARRALSRGPIRVDRARNGLLVKKTFLAVGDVLAALAELRGAGPRTAADDDQAIVVKVSAAEHRRLKVVAAESDASLADLIRRALWAAGLLESRND
jgi:hypothetical protein